MLRAIFPVTGIYGPIDYMITLKGVLEFLNVEIHSYLLFIQY
jgi:hypothetical protein